MVLPTGLWVITESDAHHKVHCFLTSPSVPCGFPGSLSADHWREPFLLSPQDGSLNQLCLPSLLPFRGSFLFHWTPASLYTKDRTYHSLADVEVRNMCCLLDKKPPCPEACIPHATLALEMESWIKCMASSVAPSLALQTEEETLSYSPLCAEKTAGCLTASSLTWPALPTWEALF